MRRMRSTMAVVLTAGLLVTALGGIGFAGNPVPQGGENVGLIPVNPILTQQIRAEVGLTLTEQVDRLLATMGHVQKLLDSTLKVIPFGGCADPYVGYRKVLTDLSNAAKAFSESVRKYGESLQPSAGACGGPRRIGFADSLKRLGELKQAFGRVSAYEGKRHEEADRYVREAHEIVDGVVTTQAARIGAWDFGDQYKTKLTEAENHLVLILQSHKPPPPREAAVIRVAFWTLAGMRELIGRLGELSRNGSTEEIVEISQELAAFQNRLVMLAERSKSVAGVFQPFGGRRFIDGIGDYLRAMIDVLRRPVGPFPREARVTTSVIRR